MKHVYCLLLFIGFLPLHETDAQILVYEDYLIPVSGGVASLHFSEDGRFLAAGTKKGEVLVWDLDAGTMLHTLKHGAVVNAVYVDRKSRYVVSGGSNRLLIIWDLYSGKKVREIGDYKGRINQIALSPDERLIAISGSRDEIYLVQFPEGEVTGMLRNGHKKEVLFSSFNRTGDALISVGRDNQMVLWDTGARRALRKTEIVPHTINESGIEIQGADVTPDKRKVLISFRETRLAKGGKSMIFKYNTALYDWQNGMLERIFEGNVKNIESFTITPDGRYFITDNSTVSLKKINFWDLRSGEVAKSQQIDEEISSLEVSGQGNWLALAETGPKNAGSQGIKLYKLSGLGSSLLAEAKSSSVQGADSSQESGFPGSEDQNDPGFPSGKVNVGGTYYALIIGINDYDDPMINDLDAPLKDARDLFRILSSSYTFEEEHIVFLENPKRAEIIDALDRLEAEVSPSDNLLIFYAGHGHWDENTHKGYWLPSDSQYESTANWLRNSSLTGYISSIKSKHTLLIADACFAGSIFKTRAAFSRSGRAVERLYSMPSRKAMTSGTLKEVPDESVFLRFLMKRLEENQEDYLPSEQLFFSLKPAVLNNSKNVPQFGEVRDAGDEGGDFIFVRRK